jgi:nucleoside phosphorylase
MGDTEFKTPPSAEEVEPIEGLICFAVKEEAEFLGPTPFQTLITGIGRRKALVSLRVALARVRPAILLSCGFAGGLKPHLRRGTIVFDEDSEVRLGDMLEAAGAVRGKLHCSEKLIPTAREKLALGQSTGADAVEMESAMIRTFCRQYHIPSATIRVILDTVDEDLPLDFSEVMKPDDQISYWKLFWRLSRDPRLIGELKRFRKQTREAAESLGSLLTNLLAPPP